MTPAGVKYVSMFSVCLTPAGVKYVTINDSCRSLVFQCMSLAGVKNSNE